jgi:hypothetical protein
MVDPTTPYEMLREHAKCLEKSLEAERDSVKRLEALVKQLKTEVAILKRRKPTPTEPRNVPDHLYVMARPNGGPVKVGISFDPHVRVSRINVPNELGPLQVIFSQFVGENARALERKCHNALRAYRCNGQGEGKEWFRVDLDVALRVVKSSLMGV